MKFNITFMGSEAMSHLRRDVMLLLKAGLRDLGHEVMLSHQKMEMEYINLIMGGYFLPQESLDEIYRSGCRYYCINTEVIQDDMLNFNPDKVDFMGLYLPFMQRSLGVMDMVIDNMPEHERYGTKASFLRWAYHPILEDIQHFDQKDLDFYFFGSMSERRKRLVLQLKEAGFKGTLDATCSNYVRNSMIERAKINLNIIQMDIYTHVNCFRIGYLNNNACAVLSEKEHDPAGYLERVQVCDEDNFVDAFAELLPRYKAFGEAHYDEYKKIHMKQCCEQMLDELMGEGS